jgi:hypothetical protein
MIFIFRAVRTSHLSGMVPVSVKFKLSVLAQRGGEADKVSRNVLGTLLLLPTGTCSSSAQVSSYDVKLNMYV